MNIARFALRNQRAIVFGVVLVTVAGLYALGTLPSGIYPEVEFPTLPSWCTRAICRLG